MSVRLAWQAEHIPGSLTEALRLLGDEYPLVETTSADISLRFAPDPTARGFIIKRDEDRAVITYGQTCHALRAVGTLLAGLVKPEETYAETTGFETLGIMLDCSRNAVMTVAHCQRWLRRLALMGFNMVMLYTDDTYQLDGEDYFGYMRGRYSPAELRDIDDHAHGLGIEMIGCIQTLGHLRQALKWSCYQDVRDTYDIILVGEDKTYALLEKMIARFADVYRSRRIHIGMDEAHDLGLGRYREKNGFRPGYDIFTKHMDRVVAICEKYALRPMIWSDMYFRMGSPSREYRDPHNTVPPEVIERIPKNLDLVYWDYYNEDEQWYADWIEKHRALGSEPLMGSMVLTWLSPWYGHKITQDCAAPCLRACRKAGLKEVFFTMWGDDGAYCDIDSGLAGLAFVSELAYTGHTDDAVLENRFAAVCTASYAANVLAGQLGQPWFTPKPLWDDPLLAMGYRNYQLLDPALWKKNRELFSSLPAKLAPYKDDRGAGHISHAILIAELLAAKMRLAEEVRDIYRLKNRSEVGKLQTDIQFILDRIDKLDESFRRMWMARNKPFGLETLQIRMAGMKRRFQELAQRLDEWSCGRIDCISEFDEPMPENPVHFASSYVFMATGSQDI